jgi:predicted HicB family RNase H-like nuclease
MADEKPKKKRKPKTVDFLIRGFPRALHMRARAVAARQGKSHKQWLEEVIKAQVIFYEEGLE